MFITLLVSKICLLEMEISNLIVSTMTIAKLRLMRSTTAMLHQLAASLFFLIIDLTEIENNVKAENIDKDGKK